jgi:hypothetical protein
MKKMLFALLICLPCTGMLAQPTPSEALLEQYTRTFRSITDKGPERSFLEIMQDCNGIVCTINEAKFTAAKKYLAQQTGIQSDSTLIRLLTDSLLTQFFTTRLIRMEGNELQPYYKVFTVYNYKLCNCLQAQLAAGNDAMLGQYSQDCNTELFKDSATVAVISTETNKLSPGMQQLMSRLLPQYIYANCAALQRSYIREAVKRNISNFYAALQQQRQLLEAHVLREAFANRTSAIQAAFPGYKKYKADLWKAAQTLNGNLGQSAFLDYEKADGNYVDVVTAYVAKGKNFSVLGQLRYTFANYGTEDFKLIGFSFIPADKVKNKAMYAKRYASLPPDTDPLFKVSDIKRKQ